MGARMLFLDEYRSAANVFSMPAFMHSILREKGTYLKTMLFGTEHVTSHNPIFAILLHSDPNDAWVSSSMKYQATICYDMRYLCLDRGCVEYELLRRVFQNILQCEVTLLGFSSFERAVGLYSALLDILLPHGDEESKEYCCLFRRETSSMVDMHLRLVLDCFLSRREQFADAPWQCEVKQIWGDFFDDVKQLYWYHDYVMLIVDAARRDGYSIANVEAADHDLKCAERSSVTAEQLATTRAKQSLIKLLGKAYKFRLK
jgi:hypothetical protein